MEGPSFDFHAVAVKTVHPILLVWSKDALDALVKQPFVVRSMPEWQNNTMLLLLNMELRKDENAYKHYDYKYPIMVYNIQSALRSLDCNPRRVCIEFARQRLEYHYKTLGTNVCNIDTVVALNPPFSIPKDQTPLLLAQLKLAYARVWQRETWPFVFPFLPRPNMLGAAALLDATQSNVCWRCCLREGTTGHGCVVAGEEQQNGHALCPECFDAMSKMPTGFCICMHPKHAGEKTSAHIKFTQSCASFSAPLLLPWDQSVLQ